MQKSVTIATDLLRMRLVSSFMIRSKVRGLVRPQENFLDVDLGIDVIAVAPRRNTVEVAVRRIPERAPVLGQAQDFDEVARLGGNALRGGCAGIGSVDDEEIRAVVVERR